MDKNMYGYVRVSTKEQNIERQLISLGQLGIKKTDIYIGLQKTDAEIEIW